MTFDGTNIIMAPSIVSPVKSILMDLYTILNNVNNHGMLGGNSAYNYIIKIMVKRSVLLAQVVCPSPTVS